MSKISFLSAILITSLLGSCGFHTPYKNTTLNASIIASTNNAFADELKKRFDQEASQSLIVQIDNEVQKKQTASYKSDGKASSYTLSLSIPVKVFNNNNKLLLSKDFSASIHLSKMSATQADRLQIEETYAQLRSTIVKKLLRILSKFNEN
jgi:Rare lipoprotein B family.